MSLDGDVGRRVAEIVRNLGYAGEMHGGLSLGAGGLGFDSIAVAELFLACEERFGIPLAAGLLAGEMPTLAGLVGHVERSLPPSLDR